jgi:nucleotide-binding universal stress UspA family protein
MKRSVVVPLDGSDFSEAALPMGRLLAQLTGAELHLVHVMQTPAVSALHPEDRLSFETQLQRQAFLYVDELAAAERAKGSVPVACELLAGERGVAPALCEYAVRARARWIVLTTHGVGGVSRLVMGSVAEALSRMARTPLMLLRPWDVTGSLAPAERRFKWILVPLDGSPEAEAALAPASELARATGAALSLVQIVPSVGEADSRIGRAAGGATRPDTEAALYLERLAERLGKEGVEAQSWVVANVDPAAGILTAAVERSADLIVMATHGRGGIERVILGSVADDVLRKTTLPLALVRPERRTGRVAIEEILAPAKASAGA